jgi:hypothetical protein
LAAARIVPAGQLARLLGAQAVSGGSNSIADRGVGKSHDLDLREAVLDIDLDLDGACFNAPGRGCCGSG